MNLNDCKYEEEIYDWEILKLEAEIWELEKFEVELQQEKNKK